MQLAWLGIYVIYAKLMYRWFALTYLQMEFDYANEWIMHAKLCTTVATALLILLIGGAFGGSGLLCLLVGVACSDVSVFIGFNQSGL